MAASNKYTQIGGIKVCRRIETRGEYYFSTIRADNACVFLFPIEMTAGAKIRIETIQVKKAGSKKNALTYTDYSL